MTPEQIADYAVLAMQAYDFMDEDVYTAEQIAKTYSLNSVAGFNGWKVQDGLDANALNKDSAGFSAELFKQGDNYVISLRGTDNFSDWFSNLNFGTGQVSAQLSLAIEYVEKLVAKHSIPLDKITFVGHSLGGGLASALAALYDRPAAVFDPAPIDVKIGLTSTLADHPASGIVVDYQNNLNAVEALVSSELYDRIEAAVNSTYDALDSSSVLAAMAVEDWSTKAPNSWFGGIGMPPEMDLTFTEEQWGTFATQLETYLTALNQVYATLRQNAEHQVNGYVIDGEFLHEAALLADSTSIPTDGALNFVNVGSTSLGPLEAVALHSAALLALTQVRNGNGEKIVEDLFHKIPGLVDNLFNPELTGFENHKNVKDASIFMRMLMDTSSNANNLYGDFFTEYKRIADADISDDRNPISEYFVQSGLIELGEKIRQDTDNNYLQGNLSAPGSFLGQSSDYLYQQTFNWAHVDQTSIPFEATGSLEKYIFEEFSFDLTFSSIEYGFSVDIFFDIVTPSEYLRTGFNLYSSFRAVATATKDDVDSSIDLQATLTNDTDSLGTIMAGEDPAQKANQGWFLLGSKNGADSVTGSDFSDLLITQGGEDEIHAGKGDDVVLAGDQNDKLDGGEGVDVLLGGAGNDTFYGSAGTDYFFGDDTNVTAKGGTDTADFSQITEALEVKSASSYETIVSSRSGSAVDAHLFSIEKIKLTNLDDRLIINDLNAAARQYGLLIDGGGQTGQDVLDLSQVSQQVELIDQGDGSFLIAGTGIVVRGFEKIILPATEDKINYVSASDENADGVRVSLFTGAGNDHITFENKVEVNSSQTYDEERQELSIDAGDGDDWVTGRGAAEINLGAGKDVLVHAGIGSIISLGPGGEEDKDTVNFSAGTLVTDADGYDNLGFFGLAGIRGTHLRYSGQESNWAYSGFSKVGFNSEGYLVVAPILAGDDETEYMYVANANRDPYAATKDLPFGIRAGELTTYVYGLFEGPPPGMTTGPDGKDIWDFTRIVLKEFFTGNYAGGTDPLVLDLDGDGIELTAVAPGISPMFDMDGDQFLECTGWVGADDGLLALDRNGDGKVNDITELFGNATTSGFAMLSEYDDNQDGRIDANDSIFSQLKVWRDLDQDGITDEGELSSLADHGIAAINLTATADGSTVSYNTVARSGSFERTDGSQGTIGDIEFQINNFYTKYTGDTAVDPAVAATMPNLTGRGTLVDLQLAVTLEGINGQLAQTINAVLPTLNTPDLSVLTERAFTILQAWAKAPPAATALPSNPDVPVLFDRSGTEATLLDFAVKVTETVTLEDGSSEDKTFWKLASGATVQAQDGSTILYPTLEEVLSQAVAKEGTSWGILPGARIDFIERYVGEDVPIEKAQSLNYNAISALNSMLQLTEHVIELETVRLAMQGGLKSYFTEVGFDDVLDKFVPLTDRELVPLFEKILTNSPADSVDAQAWLSNWSALLNSFLADYDRPGARELTYPFLFTTIVAAYENIGSPLSLNAVSVALGVPEDLVVYGTGYRTGTDEGDLFFIGTGGGQIESRGGNDVFVFGRDFNDTTINNEDGSSHVLNSIRFAHHTADDFIAEREGRDLILTDRTTGATIRVTEQFHEIAYSLFGDQVLPTQGVQEIVFADGTVWTSHGEIAKAVSHPKDTDDTLIGTDHLDYLDGGAGDDYLSGGDNSDFYVFDVGYGNDHIKEGQEIFLSPGYDVVLFGAGVKYEDLTFVREGDSQDIKIVLSSGDSLTIENEFKATYTFAFETIYFDRVEYFDLSASGQAERSFSSEDLMSKLLMDAKTDGNDVIYGFDRADILDGGAGDDFLSGGNEGDTYIFGKGYGHDTIDENQKYFNVGVMEGDTVKFIDVAFDEVIISREGPSDTLTFTLPDGSILDIERQFFSNNLGVRIWEIESFVFSDGRAVSILEIQEILLEMTEGNDIRYGFSGNDILDGRSGDDYLNGLDGNDTYVFGYGYGNDVVYDQTVSVFSGDADRIFFKDGITSSDVTWSRAGAEDLVATLNDGSQLTVKHQFSTTSITLDSIELFEFADGEVWSAEKVEGVLIGATDGDDTISGLSSGERFRGLKGNDSLSGGAGNDTYVYARGDGHDTITEDAWGGDADGILLEGLGPEDIQLSRTGDDLIILVPETSDGAGDEGSIRVKSTLDNQYSAGIEKLTFGDGTVWTLDDIRQKLLADASTDGDDAITGFRSADHIRGGLGNDSLSGGAGNDTYVYARGDGHDTIIEDAWGGDADGILLEGLGPEDIQLSRTGDDLIILVPETSDGAGDEGSIRVKSTLDNQYSAGIEKLTFGDGTVWTLDDIRQKLLADASTDGDDAITGFRSADHIRGGLGNDSLSGGAGNDTYVYARGDGHDTITEDAWGGDADGILLEGFGPEDIQLSRTGDDLIILVPETSDGAGDEGSIRVKSTLDNQYSAGIEKLTFGDGTVWTLDDIRQKLLADASTDGDDAITGFRSADHIRGGLGNDILTGGGGNDTFHFSNAETGHDAITDFSAGSGTGDIIELSTGVFSDFASVLASSTDDGIDTTIEIDVDTSILLKNVVIADLNTDDFRFV